jgi:hypothetical protein
VFVVIVLQDKDAISQIADLLDDYHDRVRWLVVRNYRDTSAITMYDGSKTRERLQAKGVLEIEVPCLTEVTRNKLQMSNLTVSKGCTSAEVHLLASRHGKRNGRRTCPWWSRSIRHVRYSVTGLIKVTLR